MKIKFFIVLLAMISLGYGNIANAQSDNVTLNVRLNPIQTLVVNQKIVNIDYTTTQDYAAGVSVKQDDHLTIYSTGGFEISAKSSGSTLTSSTGKNTKSINASDVKITASKGSANSLDEVTYYDNKALSNVDGGTKIVASQIGGANQKFNITYAAAGEDKYINYYSKNDDTPNTFTTTVTYTIVAM